MSNEYYVPGADGTTAVDTGTGMPGAAPGATQTMQGNPDPRNVNQVQIVQTPNPQAGSAAQVLGAVPDTSSGLATGGIPHNAQPTNVNVTPGGVSLLALLATGQLSLNQSNYGQGALIPQNGGASPQAPQPGSTAVAPVAAGGPAVPTFATPANMAGN